MITGVLEKRALASAPFPDKGVAGGGFEDAGICFLRLFPPFKPPPVLLLSGEPNDELPCLVRMQGLPGALRHLLPDGERGKLD
jgi:hypothetical protein